MAGDTQAVSLDVLNGFDVVWHTGPLHKGKSHIISSSVIKLT